MSEPATADQRRKVEDVITAAAVTVHFQPIVDLHDGLVTAYEALTRVSPEYGFSGPAELFEAAEKAGLIWELEALTRRKSLDAAVNWPKGTKLFLNSTPVVFADARFASALAADVARVPGLTPDRLVLEITELSEDQHIPGLLEQVRAAVAAGFQVALDDAGAGASGLNRMMMLRPQWVKLDREFCRGIDEDQLRQNLVRFFVHFARMSGVCVVAEGIESATELQTVTSLGVRFAQGFYLARPGSRAQTMDPAFVGEIRRRWAAVGALIPIDNQEPTLAALCRPTLVAQGRTTIASARAMLVASEDAPGLVVVAGGKVIGWCGASSLASSPGKKMLSEVMTTEALPLPAESTLHEALAAVCSSSSEGLPDPLVVLNRDQVLGIVRLREILRIATTESRLTSSGRTPVTGLPARRRADKHMMDLISLWSSRAGTALTHADAAFVDIRGFGDYSQAVGPSRSDQTIRSLAELLTMVVVSVLTDAFLAHLGDDRFLITGPRGSLVRRLEALGRAFDEQQALASNPADRGIVLRMLHLPDAFMNAHDVREVYRLEQQLRERARAMDANHSHRNSYLLDGGQADLASRVAA